ncbi:MAG: hypothetical protein PVH84_11155 [Candidatus Aminicenantes bacterium]|jgi:hypothetical protein
MTIKHKILMSFLSGIIVLMACPLFSAQSTDTTAILILKEGIFGQITILDESEDLVVELTKQVGRKVELGLDEGEYLVINIPKSRPFKAWITLEEGKSVELNPEDLSPEGMEKPEETIQDHEALSSAKDVPIPKETLLKGESHAYFFGEFGTKTTEIFDEFAVLVGGHLGWTFNHTFSVGFAGYARAEHEDEYGCGCWDWDCDHYRYCDYRGPAYGGITTAFIFPPQNLVHFKVGALFGAGYAWDRHFYIFEPEFDVVLNISQILRIQAGISYPLTDRDHSGLDDVMFNVSFRFGK